MAKVVVLMGSEKDREFAEPALKLLRNMGVEYEVYQASAHKQPERVLEIVRKYEREEGIVFLTIAGRSNALSGMVDAQTRHPVVSCPHLEGEFAPFDLFSSLRMPSWVAPLVVLGPENAVLAALKILALKDPSLTEKVEKLQRH
ncbi:MAG: AIR carboxylase family protein [Candidatus Hadarchaeales archaeon]